MSKNNYDSLEQLIYQNGLRINSLRLHLQELYIELELNTPLSIKVPYKNFPRLVNASMLELNNYELIGNGVGIHWPMLDEDLSLKGILKDFMDDLVKNGGTFPILQRIKAVA
jgi:hypothetical protein